MTIKFHGTFLITTAHRGFWRFHGYSDIVMVNNIRSDTQKVIIDEVND